MALEGPFDADRKIDTYMVCQVKKIAEEEGEKSPFKLLERDITKFLTAILIGTTTCTIYSAALAAEMVKRLFLRCDGVVDSSIRLHNMEETR